VRVIREPYATAYQGARGALSSSEHATGRPQVTSGTRPLDDRPDWEEFTAARERFFTLLQDLAELAERAELGDEPAEPHREGSIG
jgi:hypothetical protein